MTGTAHGLHTTVTPAISYADMGVFGMSWLPRPAAIVWRISAAAIALLRPSMISTDWCTCNKGHKEAHQSRIYTLSDGHPPADIAMLAGRISIVQLAVHFVWSCSHVVRCIAALGAQQVTLRQPAFASDEHLHHAQAAAPCLCSSHNIQGSHDAWCTAP